MPKNTTLLIVRHAEKPAEGVTLSPQGEARAHAYIAYFDHFKFKDVVIKPTHLIAAADATHSHRPRLTITPLSKKHALEIKTHYADSEYAALAKHILESAAYDDTDAVICWHHGMIIKLVKHLGVNAADLPETAHWPTMWPEEVFGWTLQIRFDENGEIDPTQTFCVDQAMMYSDYDKHPAKLQAQSDAISDAKTAAIASAS